MAVTILSNGSKWAGEPPDSLENLVEVLGQYPLERRFERYGNFVETDSKTGKVILFGNFMNLSHVFRIHADTAEEVAHVIEAIRENQKRPDYLTQPVT